MQGPFPPGTHADIFEIGDWEERTMFRGQRHLVTEPFVDADGDLHAADEEWVFLASMFSPLDDLLLIAVRKEGPEEWRILLHWTAEAQQNIIEHFAEHVTPIR